MNSAAVTGPAPGPAAESRPPASPRVGMLPPFDLLGRGPESARAFLAQVAGAGIDHICCGDHVSFFVGAGFDGLIQAPALALLHPTPVKKLTWSPQQTWSMPASAACARNAPAAAGPRPSRSNGGRMPTRGDAGGRFSAAAGPVAGPVTAVLFMPGSLLGWVCRAGTVATGRG